MYPHSFRSHSLLPVLYVFIALAATILTTTSDQNPVPPDPFSRRAQIQSRANYQAVKCIDRYEEDVSVISIKWSIQTSGIFTANT